MYVIENPQLFYSRHDVVSDITIIIIYIIYLVLIYKL